jgi:hypothetical protein
MAFTSRQPQIKPTSQMRRPDWEVMDASCITTMINKNIFPVRVRRSTAYYRLESCRANPEIYVISGGGKR